MTPVGVAVRPVRLPQDGAALRILVEAHVAFEGHPLEPDPDWAGRLDVRLDPQRVAVLVAEAGGQLVGYASLTTEFATWAATTLAHLDCLFVAETHRGNGVGRLLFDAVREHAVSLQLPMMRWQTPHWNQLAVAFYEKAGASHVRQHRFTLSLNRAGNGAAASSAAEPKSHRPGVRS